jgi:hypothetical protein
MNQIGSKTGSKTESETGLKQKRYRCHSIQLQRDFGQRGQC